MWHLKFTSSPLSTHHHLIHMIDEPPHLLLNFFFFLSLTAAMNELRITFEKVEMFRFLTCSIWKMESQLVHILFVSLHLNLTYKTPSFETTSLQGGTYI